MMDRNLEIEYRETARLVPFATNARTHSDAQVDEIVRSISEFGWTNPVLIDERDTIIAGHGRVLAAQKLKMGQCPCIVLAGLSDDQKRAYVIADNKLALNAGWDMNLLRTEIQALSSLEYDISLTGFNEAELLDLTYVGPTYSGNAAELQEHWKGMPSFDQQELNGSVLVVHFKTLEDRAAFADLVQQTITESTKSIWYPFEEETKAHDKRYVTE